MSCAAVIVNYFTRELVESLVDDLYNENTVSSIYIVDNSRDLSSPSLNKYKEKPVKLIVNPENRGYGAAANQGIKCARENWVLIVNPDVRFEPGCIESLLHAADCYQASIVGPRFYLDEEKLFRIPPASGSSLWFDYAQKAAQSFPLDADLFSFYWTIRHDRFWSACEPFPEPFLSGAALLIDKERLKNKEGNVFDENFFLYFEDTDLSIRTLEQGEKILCVPQAEAIHFYDQSPSPGFSKAALMNQAKNVFQAKYYGDLEIPSINSPNRSPHIEDLGILEEPFSFESRNQAPFPEMKYFEIGMSSIFIPFVQAIFDKKTFSIPSHVWNRLRSGTYFGRVRGTLTGVSEVCKWKKL